MRASRTPPPARGQARGRALDRALGSSTLVPRPRRPRQRRLAGHVRERPRSSRRGATGTPHHRLCLGRADPVHPQARLPLHFKAEAKSRPSFSQRALLARRRRLLPRCPAAGEIAPAFCVTQSDWCTDWCTGPIFALLRTVGLTNGLFKPQTKRPALRGASRGTGRRVLADSARGNRFRLCKRNVDRRKPLRAARTGCRLARIWRAPGRCRQLTKPAACHRS